MRSKLLEILLLFAAIGVAAIVGAVLSNLPENFRLTRNAVETEGIITAKERENHQYIQVEYKVGNRIYKTGGRAGSIDKEFDAVQINERVPVYYDSLAPENASPGNPNKHFESSVIETCVVSFIPILLFVFYKLKT